MPTTELTRLSATAPTTAATMASMDSRVGGKSPIVKSNFGCLRDDGGQEEQARIHDEPEQAHRHDRDAAATSVLTIGADQTVDHAEDRSETRAARWCSPS